MGQVQDKKKEQHWRRLLPEQKASGKSVAVFCRQRRIPVHQFYWWQRTLRERADQNRAQRPWRKCLKPTKKPTIRPIRCCAWTSSR